MNYTSKSAIEEGLPGIQLHGGRDMVIHYRSLGVQKLPRVGGAQSPRQP